MNVFGAKRRKLAGAWLPLVGMLLVGALLVVPARAVFEAPESVTEAEPATDELEEFWGGAIVSATEAAASQEGIALPPELLGELSAEELAALVAIYEGLQGIDAQLQQVQEAEEGYSLALIFERLKMEHPDQYIYDDGGRRDIFYPLVIPTMTMTATLTPIPTPTITPTGTTVAEGPPTPSLDTPTTTPSPTATSTPVPRPQLKLLATYLTTDERRIAIVDRQVLSVGDEIKGATITNIQDQEITVVYYNVEFVYTTRDEGDAYR